MIEGRFIKLIISEMVLIVGLSILIVLIGFSRVYLGVHYVSDVCAGFVISIFYLVLFVKVINKFKKNN